MAAINSSILARPASRRGAPIAVATFRCLASLPLAVALLLALAGMLAGATIVETYRGAAAARWYVYGSGWFYGLWVLLAINIFCAAAIRFPWQRHQTGFVVTHAGLLILLAGAAVTARSGREGRVTLQEGETASEMVLRERSRLTAFRVGRPDDRPYEFAFQARPYDWDAAGALPVGEIDGVAVNVLALIHHPRVIERWVADNARVGGPAVKLKVADPTGRPVAEAWLADWQFGEPGQIGPLRLQLERAVNDRMREDFQDPPAGDVGERGFLLAYAGEDALRIPVDEGLGHKVPLGDTGYLIEIVEYLANARPDRMGNFTSVDDVPRNPMLELLVYPSGDTAPIRQIAFAREPLLNLDGVHGHACPVTFRYHHPAVAPQVDVAFLQTGDGTLHARVASDGESPYRGAVAPGGAMDIDGGFVLEVVEHLPHARRQITFEPGPLRAVAEDEPAALVEVAADGVTEQVWMRRNDPVYGRRVLSFPSGALAVQFDLAREPLGFTIELVDFQRETNPGNAGNAGYSSRVRVIDESHGVDNERVISMNAPLTYGGLTFYLADFESPDHGPESSTFAVARDPGRALKYTGSLLVCLGIAIMFYMRAYFFRGLA